MSDIHYLDRERRIVRAIEYQRACRNGDAEACRRIVAQHQAETEATRGPSVSAVRTLGSAPDAEPA